MLISHLTSLQVFHDLDRAYRLLPEEFYYRQVKDYRRKVSRVYFHISKADSSTIRKGVARFLKKHNHLPLRDSNLVELCDVFDVIYALNRYLYEVPKDYKVSPPLYVQGQDMTLFPWSKNKSGALTYTGMPFNWLNLWPDVQKELDELSRHYKRRADIDPG